MSHSVNIKTQFKNLENLLTQFTKLGWTIQRDIKCRTYPSDPRRNEVHPYVAVNPKTSGYDVGIHVDEEKNAYFVCDFFGGSIEATLGKGMHKVKQGYAVDELKKFMYEENLSYNIEELENGELLVIAEK